MRRRLIKEQAADPTATIINAPKDELARFSTPPLSQLKGTIVNICNGPNGNPKQFRVGGKTYTIAKKTAKGYYVTYDGKILTKGSGDCEYTYHLKDGNIAILQGAAEQGLEGAKDKVLLQFGIDPKNPQTDVYFQIDEITNKLKTIIGQGGVSPLFKIWNEVIEYYYPNSIDTKILKPKDGSTTFEVPVDKQEVQNTLRVADASRYGINYNGQPFKYYVPKDASKNFVVGGSKKNATECSNVLNAYILNGIETRVGSSTESTETQSMKSTIIGCYRAGMYESGKFAGFNQGQLKPEVLQKFSPFRRKFLGGIRNEKELLNIKNIKKMLNSDAVGPNHKVDLDNPGGGGGYENPILKEQSLKLTIRQHLLELHEKKKDETEIIRERFEYITRGKNPKTDSSKSKLLMTLVKESNDLRYLGFNQELLDEQLMDVIKQSFGGLVGGGIDYLKERMAKALLDKLGPNVADTWVGGSLVLAVGNIPLGDFFKSSTYTCDYLIPVIAKSVVEEAIVKAKNKAGLKSPFFDIMRNAIVDGLDTTQFAKAIEGGLTKLLCPVITQLGSNLGDMVKKGFKDSLVG